MKKVLFLSLMIAGCFYMAELVGEGTAEKIARKVNEFVSFYINSDMEVQETL